jgi:hypothetical protein
MPNRRAMAPGRPCASGADSQVTTESAMAFWSGLAELSIQSQARPSECSVIPLLQLRVMPQADVPTP